MLIRVPVVRAHADVDADRFGLLREDVAVAGDDGHRREATGAVGLQPHLLVGEGRHLGDGDGLHRAAGEAVEAPVDVHLDLAGKAGKGLDLQHVVVLRLVVDDADSVPRSSCLYTVDDLPAGQPRRLVHGAQVGPFGRARTSARRGTVAA